MGENILKVWIIFIWVAFREILYILVHQLDKLFRVSDLRLWNLKLWTLSPLCCRKYHRQNSGQLSGQSEDICEGCGTSLGRTLCSPTCLCLVWSCWLSRADSVDTFSRWKQYYVARSIDFLLSLIKKATLSISHEFFTPDVLSSTVTL